jgi:hypothetical protein
LRLGIYIFSIGTAAAGLLDLVFGEFEAAHQPIQALGDHIPGQQIMAYIAAVWLVVAGIAISWRPTTRAGAAASGLVYSIFGAFWLPRLYTAPHAMGFSISIIIVVLSGLAQQLILVAAAVLVYLIASEPNSERQCRLAIVAIWTFGLCCITFGLAHFAAVQATASFVPAWIPLGQSFWAIATGISFVLAGLAILSRILAVLAARCLAVMLLGFSVLDLGPRVFAGPHDHVVWGGNAYNLAAVGAAWIIAESMATSRLSFVSQK